MKRHTTSGVCSHIRVRCTNTPKSQIGDNGALLVLFVIPCVVISEWLCAHNGAHTLARHAIKLKTSKAPTRRYDRIDIQQIIIITRRVHIKTKKNGKKIALMRFGCVRATWTDAKRTLTNRRMPQATERERTLIGIEMLSPNTWKSQNKNKETRNQLLVARWRSRLSIRQIDKQIHRQICDWMLFDERGEWMCVCVVYAICVRAWVYA